jgi:phosphoenolpyruvate synthase/pyruvate phosphate dikinase
VIEHKLGIDPAFKPIKQKERRYTLERRETIQVEVNKLLEARFIRTVDYPSWHIILENQIGRNIEAYIDDIVVKYKSVGICLMTSKRP